MRAGDTRSLIREGRRRFGTSLAIGLACLAVCGCGTAPEERLLSGQAAERIRAIRELARRDGGAAADALARATHHPDTMTCAEAVRALGRMASPRARERLSEAALDHPRARLRLLAVQCLGRGGHPEAAETLRAALKTDVDAGVRAEAARALAYAGTMADVPLLVGVAEAETDAGVQSAAIGAVEAMLKVDFRFDRAASEAERRAAVQRIRQVAIRGAVLMNQGRPPTQSEVP